MNAFCSFSDSFGKYAIFDAVVDQVPRGERKQVLEHVRIYVAFLFFPAANKAQGAIVELPSVIT